VHCTLAIRCSQLNNLTNMIKLEKFTESDFDNLISWIKSEEELNQFAGPIFSFPLTTEQLNKYVSMTDKEPFKIILEETKETIGHCELNHENGNNRLSRILIGEQSSRSKGYGKIVVAKMVAMLFEKRDVKEVDLNVFDWNLGAIKCYENVGFNIDPENSKTQIVNGKTWTSLHMTMNRNNWLQQCT